MSTNELITPVCAIIGALAALLGLAAGIFMYIVKKELDPLKEQIKALKSEQDDLQGDQDKLERVQNDRFQEIQASLRTITDEVHRSIQLNQESINRLRLDLLDLSVLEKDLEPKVLQQITEHCANCKK